MISNYFFDILSENSSWLRLPLISFIFRKINAFPSLIFYL